MRFGQSVECDAVFAATASGNLDRMRAAFDLPTNGVERHYLFVSMIERLEYLQCKDPSFTEELLMRAEMHLSELPALMQELERHEVLSRAAWGFPPKPFMPPHVPSLTLALRLKRQQERRHAPPHRKPF
jgi:hypothetical protein